MSWAFGVRHQTADVEKRRNHNKDLGGLEEFLCETDLTKKAGQEHSSSTDSAMNQPIMTLSCRHRHIRTDRWRFPGHLTAPRWQGSHQCHTSSMTLFKSEAWGCFHFSKRRSQKKGFENAQFETLNFVGNFGNALWFPKIQMATEVAHF